jgi:HAD-superfamily hydrolase, subfamily IIB
MNNKIKIAFFDIDGTLASNINKNPNTLDRVPKSALKTLKQLKENGITPVVATGRGRVGVSPFIKELGLDSFISANGQSLIYKNQEIYKKYIDPTIVKEALNQLIEINDITIGLETSIGRVLCRTNEKSGLPNLPFVESIEDCLNQAINYNVYQLSLYGENLKNKVPRNISDLEAIVVAPTAMNILPKNVSKALGIEKMLEILGLSRMEAIAFGDEENDLEMFKAVDYSVAMGNANSELKKIASFVTSDVDDDGIYKACIHFDLI